MYIFELARQRMLWWKGKEDQLFGVHVTVQYFINLLRKLTLRSQNGVQRLYISNIRDLAFCHSQHTNTLKSKNNLWDNGSTNTCTNTLKHVNDKSSHILVNMFLFTCWLCACVCVCIVCLFGRRLLQEMRLKRNSLWFIVFSSRVASSCVRLCVFVFPLSRCRNSRSCMATSVKIISYVPSFDSVAPDILL